MAALFSSEMETEGPYKYPWITKHFLAVQYHVSHLQSSGCRIVHLSDSYVCISIKGRSASKQLMKTLRKLNAFLLAHGIMLIPRMARAVKWQFVAKRSRAERIAQRRNVILRDAGITKKTQERIFGLYHFFSHS